jgi:hypothetical protein
MPTRIWLRFFKKDSGAKSITPAEALDQALCFGWIDGQAKPHDGHPGFRNSLRAAPKAASQKLIPRTSGGWSKPD